jgi:hypothetical protein
LRLLEQALRELLIEKGVFTAADIQRQIELTESRTPALGAKAVARAWVDPEFRQRLLADAKTALSGFLGIDLLIVAPHLVGAPEAPLSASIDGGNIVRQLWLFAYLANALFWVLLGAFVGLLHAEEGK